MKIKANKGFGGVLSMRKGQILEYDNDVVLQDLLKAGYIEEIKEEPQEKNVTKKKKGECTRESKRNNK